MKAKTHIAIVIAAAVLIALGNVLAQSPFAQSHHRAPRQPPHQPIIFVPSAGSDFGDPLPNLTAGQFADFAAGLEEFESGDDTASGLGPIFNDVSCVACHSTPAAGGASAIFETRFGKLEHGHFDPLAALGGSLLQSKAIDPLAPEVVPPQANIVAKRLTTPLFGAGLIEAILDSTIIQGAMSPKPDGITGRPSMVKDVTTDKMRVGRFGWKAQQATLLAFAGDAYLNEMGITNRFFQLENAPNGNTDLLLLYDTVLDPEDQVDPATGKADIDKFADFMRFLAPPPQLAPTPAAKAGATLFAQIGCTSCHQPTMMTGPNNIKALDHKLVPLFSDLLLHDMGSLGDGIAQGAAGTREMRTAPLWGLRGRGPYLHDGRALTVDAAIRVHDGEADRARDRYNRLSPSQQQRLLEFLNSI